MSDSSSKGADSVHVPFLHPEETQHQDGGFTASEVQLANRNSGTLLETLRHDVTPIGAHYLLSHFDVPYVSSEENWTLKINGCVTNAFEISLAELKTLPRRTERVTLECAGNGRILMQPRWPSQPWANEAVGTAEWTGTPLAPLLIRAGIDTSCADVVFFGNDRGISGGDIHNYGRSLSTVDSMHEDIMLVYEMNGQPLLPQHGFPLRLVVPGWYGMASVKWLNKIVAIDKPFDGHQQVKTYVLKDQQGTPTQPISTIKVRSLMIPPGIPDWISRKRLVEPGIIKIHGRAWSGNGTPITRVEFSDNDTWVEAKVDPNAHKYAWTGWSLDWYASAGRHELKCRATDANGDTQPLEDVWDYSGFCNNTTHAVEVWCA